ncbi:MAG: hypothetical protein AAFY28_21205 [Actinomycetota bacterium]
MDPHTHVQTQMTAGWPERKLLLQALSLIAVIVAAAVAATFALIPSAGSSDTAIDRGCDGDEIIVTGGRGGTITTPDASFAIIGSSFVASTDAELCGNLLATSVDPHGESRPTNNAFEITEAVLENGVAGVRPALHVRMEEPLSAPAEGTLVGRAGRDPFSLDGLLFDVDSGEIAAAIEGWRFVPQPVGHEGSPASTSAARLSSSS